MTVPFSGLLKTLGAGYAGYGADKADMLKDALTTRAAERQATQDAIENFVKLRGAKKLQLGDPGFATARGEEEGAVAGARIPADVERETKLAPVRTAQAVDQATKLAAIHTAETVATGNAMLPIKGAEAEQSAVATERHAPPIAVTNKDGSTTFVRRADAIGQQKPTTGAGSGNLAAPMAAKVGQFGEMLKKASDLLPSMDGLDVSVGGSAASDLAQHGAHLPLFGTIPGSKGVGSLVMNHSPEYAKYQAQLDPFVLAAAHALSGARINQDQVAQIKASIEFKPGDEPSVREQKRKNLIDLINSIGGTLPADAITAQENQMDATTIENMVGRGYRRRSGASDHPAAGGDATAKARPTQSQYDAARASGHSDADIAAHYDLTGVTRKP